MLWLAPAIAFGQTASINKVEMAGDKIVVHYKLESPNQTNTFLLQLYSSKDNFAIPLAKVTGDVGMEVRPGPNNRIEWAIREELGNYKGRIALELRGKVYIPFVKLQNFNTAGSYKRGKFYDLSWKAGNSDPINIELFKGNERIQAGMSHPNNGSFTLNIPPHAQTGKDYRLKISSTKNADEVLYSPYFSVTPKVPMLVKALVPIAVIGGAVVALGGGSKSDDGTTTTGGGDLPLPNFPNN